MTRFPIRPRLQRLRLASDPVYQTYYLPHIAFNFLFLRMDQVKTVVAERKVTDPGPALICTGPRAGRGGHGGDAEVRSRRDTLKERIDCYTRFVLDFQPRNRRGGSHGCIGAIE